MLCMCLHKNQHSTMLSNIERLPQSPYNTYMYYSAHRNQLDGSFPLWYTLTQQGRAKRREVFFLNLHQV